MKPFTLTTDDARRKFLNNIIWKFLLKFSNFSDDGKALPDDLFTSLGTLQGIKMGFAEDMNQLLHATAIITAFERLCALQNEYRDLTWTWHPTQGGYKKDEPDLRGCNRQSVVVSVEVKTSHDADGSIRTALRNVIWKLSNMDGRKVLFVANEEVVEKVAGFAASSGVEVRSLEMRRVPEEHRGRIHREILTLCIP